ncbi:MAG TPA: hypothetical protein VGO56_00345 [Pyrinomonadaceae bacterium]|jgi:hypothetical protein|nr:hypothetical protein [Pyrinomonadaceae bacterium]
MNRKKTSSQKKPASPSQKPIHAHDEGDFLTQILLLTGREGLLATKLAELEALDSCFHALWSKLKSTKCSKLKSAHGQNGEARADLFNRLLLSLGIMSISPQVFRIIFGNVDFSDHKEFETRVNSFRILCMLEYGNFRYGYKSFRRNALLLQDKWEEHFPGDTRITRGVKVRLQPAPVGLIPIQPGELFALDLDSDNTEVVNSARKHLKKLLESALAGKVNSFASLKKIAQQQKVNNFTSLIANVGLPGAENLLKKDHGASSYRNTLQKLHDSCNTIDETAVERIQRSGISNAAIYRAMHDLSVYVATSMREPLHFTTNWAFVQGLFHSGALENWGLRYFDPTQAFVADRIQTGLLECLMLKRAQLTVYHAQESDTFGKDCEAGVTMAQGKPVVVFVTRLFESQPKMKKLYALFDKGVQTRREQFLSTLVDNGILKEAEAQSLLIRYRSLSNVIAFVVAKQARLVLKNVGVEEIEMELFKHGYDPNVSEDLREYTVKLIVNLERRALTFRAVHPLALQTSPMDGVARGVIVTRTVADTAKVIKGLLTKTLRYRIVYTHDNWLLVDTITHSPVRVVTRDPILTAAFWNERWGNHKHHLD